MIRASRAIAKIKYGAGKDPLKAPRRIKEYTYVYKPTFAKDKIKLMKKLLKITNNSELYN